MSRRESVGRLRAASQSDGAPPAVKMVSCAVLPPQLTRGAAPPTDGPSSGGVDWDVSQNWQHPRIMPGEGRRKSLFRKTSLTPERQRADTDRPPFVMRQVPYDTWRKHYAKDKDGNYRGTHAPAEDCLLKPDDVQKWRFGDPMTLADKWTRGKEALPVYSEVRDEGALPEYQVDYHDSFFQPTAPNPTQDDGRLAPYFDASETTGQSQRSLSSPPTNRAEMLHDGRSADEIIGEAQARGKGKETWKQKASRGFQMSMGSSAAVGGFGNRPLG
ncbi:hypothetical protein H2200_008433 [Cladophialophora chaetospira]|uniref:Uncharacterized protein n=1 Tax=Cladophialophora chaetospira TaxID=386627 RepID=A0AA39CGG7_9EURO|nr:hypothetical protein H2200_008433 [Cladophialophora chaetospira]